MVANENVADHAPGSYGPLARTRLKKSYPLSNPCASNNFSSSRISLVNPSATISPSSMIIVRGNNSRTSFRQCMDTSMVIGGSSVSKLKTKRLPAGKSRRVVPDDLSAMLRVTAWW